MDRGDADNGGIFLVFYCLRFQFHILKRGQKQLSPHDDTVFCCFSSPSLRRKFLTHLAIVLGGFLFCRLGFQPINVDILVIIISETSSQDKRLSRLSL